MKLKIKSICSTDIDNLESWSPGSLEEIYIYLEIEIGAVGMEGADLFYCRIATPEGFRAMIEGGKVPIPNKKGTDLFNGSKGLFFYTQQLNLSLLKK